MENFLNRLTEDEDLRSLFLAQDTIDGAYSVAKPYLEDITKEEFAKEMVGLARNIIETEPLSQEELKTIGGGRSVKTEAPWKIVAQEFINRM